MKQGTNSLMRININYNLDDVKSIRFLFKQNEKRLEFIYPSDNAVRAVGSNSIFLVWSAEDTYMFSTNSVMKMDTLIKLNDSEENPETKIVTFKMNPTLFEKGDVLDD